MSEGCFSPRYVEMMKKRIDICEIEVKTANAKLYRAEQREAECLDMLEAALKVMREGIGTPDLCGRIERALRDWRPGQ
jgi:hypothetical protein